LTQWLDAPEGATPQNIKRLVDATRGALAGERIPHPQAPSKLQTRWIAGALLGLVLLAGVILFLKSRKPVPPPGGGTTTTGVVTTPPVAIPPESKPKTWLNPADGLKYAWIPPGTFMMGCSVQDSECRDDEKPTHQVAIDKGFWMGQTEVTVAAYRKFAPKSAPASLGGDGTLPMSGVSWAEAKNFCVAMGGRLPTEAEWEYAARAGSAQPYYGVLSQIAWYGSNSGDAPHPVGTKQPNAFGLYDMLGNVSEWVLNRYFNKYDFDSAERGPDVEQPLASNATATARGGFWENDASGLRVSRRLEQEKEGDQIPIGFRCARDKP
jgi:formylglycine-generating enzyme required for sulfatase activity